MANKKAIRTRIKSVSNTKKITRTMELVATARSKKAQDRLRAAQPYTRELIDMVGKLVAERAAGAVDHPLFEDRVPGGAAIEGKKPAVGREALLVITANRGLCGGYNTNLLKEAMHFLEDRRSRGVQVDLYVMGKKGNAWLSFRKVPITERFPGIDDKPGFQDATALAERFMKSFLAGGIDRAFIIHQHYHSAGQQKPRIFQVLPVARTEGKAGGEFIYEPDPQTILNEILPIAVRTAVYMAMLEAATGEQIARRVAMKLATDNAEEMVGSLKKLYNRKRQDDITKQIAEIVGGAAALD